jgi:hypothetical protein
MKTLPLIFFVAVGILLVACGKDKFETKPRLEVKDYSSKEIHQGENLRIRLNYFDKEGDLSEAPVIGILKRLNLFPIPPAQDKVDTFRNNLPEFPKNDNGEIAFELPYDFLKESTVENDTIMFRFAVTDRGGHSSDTIETAPLVILLP